MMSLHPQRSRARSAAATIAAMLALVPAAPTPGVAGEALPGPISAEVVEVIDGDTLAVRARIWLGQELTVRARIAGIDAPELRGRCAAERDLAVRARAFLIAAVDGHPIAMSDIRYGKYAGRVIARVRSAAGLDLGAALLAKGLACAYDGRGPRPRWCAGA